MAEAPIGNRKKSLMVFKIFMSQERIQSKFLSASNMQQNRHFNCCYCCSSWQRSNHSDQWINILQNQDRSCSMYCFSLSLTSIFFVSLTLFLFLHRLCCNSFHALLSFFFQYSLSTCIMVASQIFSSNHYSPAFFFSHFELGIDLVMNKVIQ